MSRSRQGQADGSRPRRRAEDCPSAFLGPRSGPEGASSAGPEARARLGRVARTLAALALLAFSSSAAHAEETAAFLKLGVGARPAALGGAFTALADDASAIAWNPAGIGLMDRRNLSAMHAELAANTRYDFLGMASPAGWGAWGASLAHLSQGSLEGRDATGKPTGSFAASDTALQLAAASPLGDVSRLGLGVKLIQSRIAEVSASGWAVDLGAMRSMGSVGPGAVRLGAAVQNLGPGMRFLDTRSDLPLTMAVGTGYVLPFGLTFAADFKHRPYAVHKTEFGLGTEYALLGSAVLRAGYASSATGFSGAGATTKLGGLGGLGAGLGLKLRGMSFDYAFTPLGELGNAQRFSVSSSF